MARSSRKAISVLLSLGKEALMIGHPNTNSDTVGTQPKDQNLHN
jgi:hypothetical protein